MREAHIAVRAQFPPARLSLAQHGQLRDIPLAALSAAELLLSAIASETVCDAYILLQRVALPSSHGHFTSKKSQWYSYRYLSLQSNSVAVTEFPEVTCYS